MYLVAGWWLIDLGGTIRDGERAFYTNGTKADCL